MSKQGLGCDASLNPIVRRLTKFAPLSGLEGSLINALMERKCYVPSGDSVSRVCRSQRAPRAIASGWAVRSRTLPNGNAQILSIFLPGDLIDAGALWRPLDSNEVTALTPVATVSLAPLYPVITANEDLHRNLRCALDLLEKEEEARLIDHMVRLGCQPALERAAGFFLDLYRRVQAIGFVHGNSFVMPLTQESLGSALGLSVVHVSRLLRTLRERNVLHVSGGVLYLESLELLIALAGATAQDPLPSEAPLWAAAPGGDPSSSYARW